MKTVSIQYYDGVDEYGQELANLQSTKEIEATFGLISKTDVNQAVYLQATHYLLTTDNSITDKCKVLIDNHEYKVKYVNKHRRLSQVFLE